MPIAYAILVGVAPMIITFFAAFFGASVGLGWSAYILWFIASLVIGAIVMIVRRT